MCCNTSDHGGFTVGPWGQSAFESSIDRAGVTLIKCSRSNISGVPMQNAIIEVQGHVDLCRLTGRIQRGIESKDILADSFIPTLEHAVVESVSGSEAAVIAGASTSILRERAC